MRGAPCHLWGINESDRQGRVSWDGGSSSIIAASRHIQHGHEHVAIAIHGIDKDLKETDECDVRLIIVAEGYPFGVVVNWQRDDGRTDGDRSSGCQAGGHYRAGASSQNLKGVCTRSSEGRGVQIILAG